MQNTKKSLIIKTDLFNNKKSNLNKKKDKIKNKNKNNINLYIYILIIKFMH